MARKKRFERKQDAQDPKKEKECESKGRPDTNSWNDVSWYTHYPDLIASSSRVPFPYRPGMQFTAERTPLATPDGGNHIPYRVPGVCQMVFDWTIGVSADTKSPASLAAFQMYRKIRRAYSGSLQADPPDIMMYALALDQVYAYISFLKRIYRTINTFDSQNLYLPEIVLSAQISNSDVNQLDLSANRVTLWNGINRLVHMINQFKVPADLDIFKRHSFMCEHVYADAPMVNSQLYLFCPDAWYFLKEDQETGTKLEHLTEYALMNQYLDEGGPEDGATVNYLLWVGNKMVESLLNWDDAHTINGYIMRAFEGSEFYSPALLMQDELLQIDYVPEVLLQIHNATRVQDYSSGDITQDPVTGAIIHAPTLAYNLFRGPVMIDMPTNTPSEPEIVLATRLTASVSEDGQLFTSGTEVVTNIAVYVDDPNWAYEDASFLNVAQQLELSSEMGPSQMSYVASNIRTLFSLAAWSWFPRLPFQFSAKFHDEQYAPAQYAFYVSEISCPSTISWDQLRGMHEVCLYSEFDSFT